VQRRHQCVSMVGRWRISLPPIAALWALAFALQLVVVAAPTARAADDAAAGPVAAVEYAQPISNRLNPTGRTVSISVPLKDGELTLGETVIQLTASDNILIEKAGFTEHLAQVLNEPALQAVAALPDSAGFVPIESFADTGVGVRFDPGLQELLIDARAEQRPAGNLSLGGYPTQRPSAALIQPQSAAGYVNITVGLDQLWETDSVAVSSDGRGLSGRVEFDSGLRAGGVVVENRAAFDGDVDTNVCPVGATCRYGHVAGLKRQSSRLIYDIPEQQMRVTLGDTDAVGVPLQRSAEVLGLSVEKSARKLNPGENLAAASAGSFRLERASSVDVIVNGAVVQRLQLRPGNYNLRDLPLSAGANSIELAITADNGERQTQMISAYSDPGLLAAGKSEWAFAAGLPSYLLDNERSYSGDGYFGTGIFRYGFNDGLTALANLQGDGDVIMGGLGADIGTRFGIVGLHGAASAGEHANGLAANIFWSYSNFDGWIGDGGESLHFNAEYRSPDFRTPNEHLEGADGILFADFNYWLSLAGSWSAPITEKVTATLSARYMFDDDGQTFLHTDAISEDRFGLDLTLASSVTPTVNASFLIGYSNELYRRGLVQDDTQDGEFRAAIRFNVRPGDHGTVSGGYDTLGNQATVSAYQGAGSGIGRWDTSIDVQNRGYEEVASVNATAGYTGNRAEVRVSHYADADGSTSEGARQRTSLRAGTAIAFAGDKVAIGAPVRGGAFAVVAPHPSLAGREISAGGIDNAVAKADTFGNGLVSNIPAYMPGSISVDVDDLPLGYSLGSGAFDTLAPYKAGYAIEVGSNYSVSVVGTLTFADGQPVALVTGIGHPEEQPDKVITLFTNSEGRFGAEGLAPGRWIVDMATEGSAARFVIEIPAGTDGLFQAGTLTPVKGSSS
jgi:outer membrane usher protein